VFTQIYKKLKEELLADPAFEFTPESHEWIDRVTISLPSPSPLAFLSFSVQLAFLLSP
jgi:hypothetical protein